MKSKIVKGLVLAIIVSFSGVFVGCNDSNMQKQAKIQQEQQLKKEQEAKKKVEQTKSKKITNNSNTKTFSTKSTASSSDSKKTPTSLKSRSSKKRQLSRKTNSSEAPKKNGQTVYLTATGKKYHSKPKCGNTKTSWSTDINSAIKQGYRACSKCF